MGIRRSPAGAELACRVINQFINRVGWILGTIWAVTIAAVSPAAPSEEFVVTIPTTLGDTTETFWFQVPAGYSAGMRVPLLLGWHQLGADHLELKQSTKFDSICDARVWLLAAPAGPIPSHWNNHAAQSHAADVIHWIERHYSVDTTRIYVVGASMGGGGGMVFANNHLDPGGPMVAAAASCSGIQDCERRFHEQGWNNSMVAAFGGSPEEVPFTYHRNSPICFADSAMSMHRNARHLPLLLSFGRGQSDAVWRSQAEDLYTEMTPCADTVLLHESSRDGHGWASVEEEFVCDFLGSFSLPAPPKRISINADEEGRWYWADVRMRNPVESFGRFEAELDAGQAGLRVVMVRNVASLSLDLPMAGFTPGQPTFTARWEIGDSLPADLGLRGLPLRPSVVLFEGTPFSPWEYDERHAELTLHGTGSGTYTIIFAVATTPQEAELEAPAGGPRSPGQSNPGDDPLDHGAATGVGLQAWYGGDGMVRYRLDAAGPLGWRLYDVAGRSYAGRPATWTNAGDGVIPIAGAPGVYFLRLERPGRLPVRLKVPLVR